MAAIVVKGYRPSKHSAIPPPLYLTSTTIITYCSTCARLLSPSKKSQTCSAKCKKHPPNLPIDILISTVLYSLLLPLPLPQILASLPSAPQDEVKDTRRPGPKGDNRVLVPCALVESLVFGRPANVNRAQGRRRARAERGEEVAEAEREEAKKGDYDEEVLRAALARLKARDSRLGEEKPAAPAAAEEDEEDGEEEEDGVEEEEDVEEEGKKGDERDEKRREGMLRATQRERVRNACRRAVVFGLSPPGTKEDDGQAAGNAPEKKDDDARPRGGGARRKRAGSNNDAGKAGPKLRRCEAVMRGAVVEPSYAKGDWGVRWAEEGN